MARPPQRGRVLFHSTGAHMKNALVLAAGMLTISMGLAAIADAEDSAKSASNPNGCKVVQLKPGESTPSSGSMTSSVTAGGGKTSGYTTGPNSVTVHSGNGSTSSTVTTGSSSSSGGSTTVTSANGDCTVYVNPGEKK